MRNRNVLWIALAFVLLWTSTGAKGQVLTADENPLSPLSWMIGGKWVAEGDKGPDGKPFHVESKINRGENQRVIQFTTRFRVDGKLVPVYTGIYAWHPAKKKIVFLYTDNHGSLTEGEAVMTGDRLEQEFQITGADGVARLFRSTIIRHGQDDYDWSVLQQKDGAWTVMFGLKYKRVRE